MAETRPKSKVRARSEAVNGQSLEGPLPGDVSSPFARPDDALASLSPKGLRTRRRLLDGARRAFEKEGSYLDTRISDIVKESGCAYGTFYTYFDTKEQIFYELAVEVVNEIYVENASRYRGENLAERIGSALRQFLKSYRDHAAIMTIIEQAASLFPDFACCGADSAKGSSKGTSPTSSSGRSKAASTTRSTRSLRPMLSSA